MKRSHVFAAGAAATTLAALAIAAQGTPPGHEVARVGDAAQWAEYDADTPKSIVELQPFRRSSAIAVDTAGGVHLTVTLTNLNPQINAWFLLTLHATGEAGTRSYHIENIQPQTQVLALDQSYPDGLRITSSGRTANCALWPEGQPTVLDRARQSGLPDAPICNDRLYLRNATTGTYTNIERITNVLRDHVWGGDKIIGFIKDDFFKDAFIERGTSGPSGTPRAAASEIDGPMPASLNDVFGAVFIHPETLAIALESNSAALPLGRWNPVRDAPGIFLSAMEPQATASVLLGSYKQSVNTLDSVEAGAVDYLVALDLSQFDLAFALGTDHPRVGWSIRTLDSMRNPRLPGPDGIGSVAPLILNGIVSPSWVGRTVAAFAGGFKREHGAFHFGALAVKNSGSHYGFIEEGVIFSKLQPGLATLMVTDTGAVQMKTWTRADDASLEHIKYARQNGVPLIETDAATGLSRPGAWVNQWGPGNWSGSNDERLRTVRAGMCLQEAGKTTYLIFGYFSTATPSAMARVFQAYGCRYAMHLDMNALEHTYFALYTKKDGTVSVQHLIAGMAEVDRKGPRQIAPRFLSFPDDRDFFYLVRKR